VGVVVALGFLEQAPFEHAPLGLAGQSDLGAVIAGLAASA
jgi:hypothetical protein